MNVSRFATRPVGEIVSVSGVDEVLDLVRDAARRGRTIAPVSTGRNWGFGSREPASAVDIVCDLGGLDNIRTIDRRSGFAVIEPGVTQLALAEALVGTGLMLNLTASSAHTSVLGNALDRGVGLHRQRDVDLVGVEVVTGDGNLAKVGYLPDGNADASGYPTTVGPNVVGLFVQSNFAVVTAGTIRLLPRPDATRVMRLSIEASQLASVLPLVKGWQDQGLLSGVVKIYSSQAAGIYGAEHAASAYSVYVCASGDVEVAEAKVRLLERSTPLDVGQWVELDESSDLSATERMLLRGYRGDPTAHDEQLRRTFGVDAPAVDTQTDTGWIFCCVMIPADMAALRRAQGVVESVAAPEVVTLGRTINILPGGPIDLVFAVRFVIASAELTAAVHRFVDALYRAFLASGILPYRLDVDHMDLAPLIRGDAGQEVLIARLAGAVDPDGVFVRQGRYVSCPLEQVPARTGRPKRMANAE